MRALSAFARQRGLGLHLDGARLFIAAAYSGHPLTEYTSLFDTVYVSLWKCFNSGSGAILAGPRALLSEMHHPRRMFGGALWNAWPFAAVASHYAEGYLERLTAAVRTAQLLLQELVAAGSFELTQIPNGTNVFRLKLLRGEPETFRERLRAREIVLPPPEPDGFWLRVNETLARRPPDELAGALRTSVA
jgi:threonine aldolase